MNPEAAAQTITSLIGARVADRSDDIAWAHRDGDGRWVPTTWNEVGAEVRRVAALFAARGLSKGDRLGIIARTRREWQLAEFAGLLRGAVIVGIDAHATLDHIEFVLRNCDVSALVVDDAIALEKVPPALRDGLKFVALIDSDGERDSDGNVFDWNERPAADPPATEEWTAAAPTDAATLIYTSGATGTPKAIEVSHEQLMVAWRSIVAEFPEIEAGDSIICWLPMAHMFQRMMNLASVAIGVRIHFVDNPREVVDCAREVSPSIFVAVPRFYEKLYDGITGKLADQAGWQNHLADAALDAGRSWAECHRLGRPASLALRLRYTLADRLVLRRIREVMGGKIKFMITGTAPTPEWLLEFFHAIGLPVLEAYALSENTVPMAANRPDDFKLGSVGKPFAMNEIRFADDGEVLVRGPGVFKGYHGDERPDDRFTADGFYRTGDFGRLDEEGYLYLMGRKADIIKTSTGRRISPAAVEEVYARSAFVEHAVVFGDGRKHLTGLLTLDRAAVTSALRREGETPPQPERLVSFGPTLELLRCDLESLAEALPNHERVRAFGVLPDSFGIETGELTASLKVRRRHIGQVREAFIDRLYDDQAPLVQALPSVSSNTQESDAHPSDGKGSEVATR